MKNYFFFIFCTPACCENDDEIVEIKKPASPEVQFLRSTSPDLVQLSADDVVCIDDSLSLKNPPSPVRSCYPHFDKPLEPIDKCPVCYMDFKRSEIERHTQLCCEKTFSSNTRDTE